MHAKHYLVSSDIRDTQGSDTWDMAHPLYAKIQIDLDNELYGFGRSAEEVLEGSALQSAAHRESCGMKDANQNPLRLMPAPETATVELLYRTFGDVLIPLEKLRVQYFRNLNEQSFAAESAAAGFSCP